MRRALSYIAVFFAGIILQFGWIQYLSLWGLVPNFLIVFLIFIGLTRGSFTAQLLGFAWGLAWDTLSVDLFGSHALLFTCLGYFSGKLSRHWNESKIANQMLLTLVASVLFWFGMYLLYQVFSPAEYRMHVTYIIVLQPLYNMLVAPAVFAAGMLILRYLRPEEEVF